MSFPENKKAQTSVEILPLLANRWSPRAFADTMVEDEKLQALMEAARWTASAYNEQPWRYMVGVKGTLAYDKILSCLVEFNQMWASSAPVLMLSFVKTHFGDENEKQNNAAFYDTGAASAQLTMQAESMGLHVHQMTGIDYDNVKTVYDIPMGFEPMSALAIGYPGDLSTLPEKLQEMEIVDRERKPVNELFFEEDFGKSL